MAVAADVVQLHQDRPRQSNHAMVVPLMAAALIAHASSRLICKEGVYHALAKGVVERATSSDVKLTTNHHMLPEEMALRYKRS